MLNILLYYMLLICVIRTPARLKWLLASLVVDGCILAGLGVADYQGVHPDPQPLHRDGAAVCRRRGDAVS